MIDLLFVIVMFLVILFTWNEEDFDDLAAILGIGAFGFGFVLLITSMI